MFGVSLLGGWTCGNVLASTAEVARFVHELFAKKTVLGGKWVAKVSWLGAYKLIQIYTNTDY
jgi:hypothetical protein